MWLQLEWKCGDDKVAVIKSTFVSYVDWREIKQLSPSIIYLVPEIVQLHRSPIRS